MPACRQPKAAVNHEKHTWLVRSIGCWKWRIRPDWVHLFDAGDSPDWLALRDDPRATLVKANEGREIWRVQFGTQVVFVKICRPARRGGRWRRLLLGTDAARERRTAEYAAGHGINTVSPLASAEAPINGRDPDSILVTAGLPHARPLSEFWSELDNASPRTRGIKNQVIDAVARLIAHAHQNGLGHSDLHAGNVLIEPGPEGGYRAVFVDLHNIRTGRAVTDREVTQNLAQFNQWFRVRGLLTDRVRFLHRYLHWRDAVATDSAHARRLGVGRRELLRLVGRAALGHAEALYAKRDRRAMGTGRYFAKLKLSHGWRAHVFLSSKHRVPGSRASEMTFTTGQWKQWLRRPLDRINATDRRYVIKDSATAMICRARLALETGGPLEVVCKRSTPGRFWRRIQNSFRSSRAMLTWKRGNALLNRWIPTARPLAVLERRRFRFLLDSLIITEYVEHARDLDTVLTVQMREMPGQRQRWLKACIIESLASILRRLDDCGFVHRDLKAPNIIVQWDPESPEPPRATLVDLDGVRQSRRAGRPARMRAITRLNVSLDHCRRVTLTDRVRFLKRYLDRPGWPAEQWKPIWRTLAAQSQRKREQRVRHQEEMLAKYGRF